mmetsp:Transcript_43377/g.114246  ORF Transcript_43377/g.114246 Transcript_43377/m.114246 type:complete len:929 (+) Transcript_43377:3-2789(+)
MRQAEVACVLPPPQLDKSAPCPPLQPHQETAIFMLHPKSPVSRMLVDHPTGSGKTREMIQVLDNFFYDRRPKVPVFPKEPVCRNFYGELLRWPSKYRDYFCCLRPHSAARAAGMLDWRARRCQLWDISSLGDKELRAICKEMREVLEMKGCFYMGCMRRSWMEDFKERFPDEPLPAAPLRALRYTSAGGRHTMIREDGLPVSALFKIGFSKEDANVYSNKIVLMDEVHNLVRSQTQFGEQLKHLRSLLFGARGAVLAGFTGTPILSEPQEGRQLLDIIKGVDAPLGDSGFISSFPMRPRSLFPQSLPRGIPDAVLTPSLRRQFVRKVQLMKESLQRYDKKRSTGLPTRRLQRYCNLSVHFGAMHDGKHGSKARVLDDMESCAPKLQAMARDVAAEPSKAVVLVARSSGMDALIEHLRRLAMPQVGSKPLFGVATMEELAAFNSAANLHGELYRVLVADSTQCGEGVSFFAVRRVLLADVPTSPSALVQAVGRSIRMYGHYGLSEEEWTVTTTLYAATMPRWMRSPLGAWAYRAQRHHSDPKVAESRARHLLRKLIKVGIPTLQALRERLVTQFPHLAAPTQQQHPQGGDSLVGMEAEDASSEMALSLSQGTDSASSTSGSLATTANLRQSLSSSSLQGVSLGGSSKSKAVQAKDLSTQTISGRSMASAPVRQLKVEEAVRFLEYIGLWEEAKLMGTSQQQRAKGGASRRARPKAAAAGDGTRGGPPQHYFLRALQWLVEGHDVPQIEEQHALRALTADEEALQSLVAASRAFVPALRELRSEAIDREVLEGLMAGQADQLGGSCCGAGAESEGESSVCDLHVSGESSGDEDTGVAPPLVLPPGWQTSKVRRGKTIVREYIDPAGVRYKTEAQVRRAIDARRSSANMASRLRQRFEARFAASSTGTAQMEPALGDDAEGREGKRLRATA